MNDRYSIIKWLIFAALVVASAVVIYPPKDKVRLGLDLAGGTSFTVQIDEEQLREERKAAEPDKTDKEIDAEIDAMLLKKRCLNNIHLITFFFKCFVEGVQRIAPGDPSVAWRVGALAKRAANAPPVEFAARQMVGAVFGI